ncbi:C39 family peptidase [Bacillus solimangrovi]|uniref:Peptidase C39-like domain-containing protein n=1 Tax=Bacillus solimangrovi TaxID=1305675 RepID=A0A1E5LHQ8_9BACI|nr:C39 family peptidase [Bacillus solimangrovi]OEH93605.1 hypothetical protein BFG57_01060 [Bacillus solimangrovi]
MRIKELIVLVTFLFIYLNSTSVEAKSNILNIPHIEQMPELARGCEVTSLAMLLNSAGVEVDKMALAQEVKKVSFISNGYYGNPHHGFVGNIYSYTQLGYGVYHEPIADLAEKYLPGQIDDLTGQDISSIYASIDAGIPVWVITNSRFKALPENQFVSWKTKEGIVDITYSEHSVLVTGYDDQYIYVNDPLYYKGNRKLNRFHFEQSWIQMGSQAIAYQLKEPVKVKIIGQEIMGAYKLKDTVYIPVRTVAQTLGSTVTYDLIQQTVVLQDENTVIHLRIDTNEVIIKNQPFTMPIDVKNIEGSFVIPIQALEYMYDTKVHWENDVVYISMKSES